MSGSQDELALRKQLLVAQSALYRAQLRYEVIALRARTSRASDWVGRAITLVSVARAGMSILRFLRK